MGLQSVLWDEAVKINGADPDLHRRDLWEAIDRATFREWDLGVQLFDQDFADSFDFDVLDPTKLIPEEDVPGARSSARWCSTGRSTTSLPRPSRWRSAPQNVIPGIDFTNDPLLQGRNFSYLDTQLKRLGGPNFTQMPINAPKGCPVSNFQQDGHMQTATARAGSTMSPTAGATARASIRWRAMSATARR